MGKIAKVSLKNGVTASKWLKRKVKILKASNGVSTTGLVMTAWAGLNAMPPCHTWVKSSMEPVKNYKKWPVGKTCTVMINLTTTTSLTLNVKVSQKSGVTASKWLKMKANSLKASSGVSTTG